jgi:hypothetical protein
MNYKSQFSTLLRTMLLHNTLSHPKTSKSQTKSQYLDHTHHTMATASNTTEATKIKASIVALLAPINTGHTGDASKLKEADVTAPLSGPIKTHTLGFDLNILPENWRCTHVKANVRCSSNQCYLLCYEAAHGLKEHAALYPSMREPKEYTAGKSHEVPFVGGKEKAMRRWGWRR